MLSMLDQEYNRAIDAAIKAARDHQLALRSMNGESEAWVWPAADSIEHLVKALEFLRREPAKPVLQKSAER